MNALVQSASKPTPVEAFMGAVLRPQDRQDVERALPKHVPYERFERNLTNAIMNNPKLLECKPREVFREVAKIAALGLILDPQLGEAYLITGYGKNGPQPQVRVGYRGLIKLARQSGDVASIYAHEVHQFDDFSVELGTEKRLYHKPNIFGDRGDVVGYYAAIQYKDGDTDFEPMSIKQIEAIRATSDGWKAYSANKIKDTPWASHFGEMAKKTCIRRLLKRAPQSPDLHSAIRYEEEADAAASVRQLPPRASRSLAAPVEDEQENETPALPPRASQSAETEADASDKIDGEQIDWDAELKSYDTALSSCESEIELTETIAMMGASFVDAPEDIRAEVSKLEASMRQSVERPA